MQKIKQLVNELHEVTNYPLHKCETKIQQYVDVLARQLVEMYGYSNGSEHVRLNLNNFHKTLNTIMVSGKRHWVFSVIQNSCKHRLFHITEVGIVGRSYSEAKLNMDIQDIIIASGDAGELIQDQYQDFELDTPTDFAPIDTQSLNNYIRATKSNTNTNPHYQAKLKSNLKTAELIHLIAKETGGVLPQVQNPSTFGRMYYKGLNLQNASKVVRHASLGDCYEWDISNSVWAWKYNYVKAYLESHGEKMFLFETLEYIDKKNAIRKQIAQDIWPEHYQYKIDTVKQCLTAISFGATKTSAGYRDPAGNFKTNALQTILKYTDKLEAFVNHPCVKPLMEEQQTLNKIILFGINNDKSLVEQLKQTPALVNARGSLKTNATIAYLYQHAERAIIEGVKCIFKDYAPLLTVHDALYTKRRPNADTIQSAKLFLADNNDYVRLEETLHRGYTFDEELYTHKQRIAVEESTARKLYA